MIGRMICAVAAAVVLLGGASLPSAADEPAGEGTMLTLSAEGGALDSAALGDVSGGALVVDSTDADAWRLGEGLGYPVDVSRVAQPAGSGIADSANLGASMGAAPSAGGSALGSGAVAGDIANTIF